MENEQQPNPDQSQQSGEEKTWTSEENQFTHMSDEEKKRHLGWNPGPGELEERERDSSRNAADTSSDEETQ